MTGWERWLSFYGFSAPPFLSRYRSFSSTRSHAQCVLQTRLGSLCSLLQASLTGVVSIGRLGWSASLWLAWVSCSSVSLWRSEDKSNALCFRHTHCSLRAGVGGQIANQ